MALYACHLESLVWTVPQTQCNLPRRMARKKRPLSAARHRQARVATDFTRFAVAIGLFLIVWVVFGRTLGHGFINFDDDDYVYRNPQVSAGLTWSGMAWAFTHVHADNWHPLTTLSHMLDCQLFGLQPWGHHLTNVLLHAAAAVMLFRALLLLTARTEGAGNVWPSAFVAALFAIHPLRVESVAWVAERKDVLSGLFFMLTLCAYARYVQSERRDWRLYLRVMLLFALGLLSKPTLVTLPFVLLLLDYWPLGRFTAGDGGEIAFARAWALFLEKVPLLLLSAGSCVATLLAQKQALALAETHSVAERAGNALLAYATYLRQTVFPADLAVLYPYPPSGPGLVPATLALLLLVGASAVFLRWRKEYPHLLVGWLWFLGVLVPMIGLVQVGMQPHADRYTYLAQIGLALMAAWGARELLLRWPIRREITGVLAAVILGALMLDAYSEASYWRESATLWQHALDGTSDNYIAENTAGKAYLEKGETAEAIAHFQRALALKADQPVVEGNLGKALLRAGAVAEATSHFEKELLLDPGSADALLNVGNALLGKGQVSAAISDYEKALQAQPDFVEVHNNLGIALVRAGRLEEAIASYRKAIALRPTAEEAEFNLGNALAGAGKLDEAITAYEKAVMIRPGYAQAHNKLGVTLAAMGRSAEAVAEFRTALRLKPDLAEAANRLRELGAERPHD